MSASSGGTVKASSTAAGIRSCACEFNLGHDLAPHNTSASIEVERLAVLAAAGLTLIYVLLLASQIGLDGGWLYDRHGRPFSDDFTGVYSAGSLINDGHATAVYDWTLHKAAHAHVTGRETFAYFQFPYPPTMFVTAALLAALPYALAKLTWIIATLAVYLAAVWQITGRTSSLLFAAAAPAVLLNAYLGQNGFLTAGLLGLAVALLPARPLLAGVLTGVLTIKPHLGVLIPLALIAGGHGRAFMSAALTAAAMALASVAVYGVDAWGGFLGQLGAVGNLFAITTEPEKLQSLYGLLRSLGLPHAAAINAHGLFALIVAAIVVGIWRRPDVPQPLKAAVLIASAYLASPYLFIYDLTGLLIAQAFLVVNTRSAETRHPTTVVRLVLPHVLVLASPFVGLPTGFLAAGFVFADSVARAVPLSMPRDWRRRAPSATMG